MALLGGLALLAALYLALSSQTAVLGRRVQDLEAERALIIRENAYLRDQIARFASVSSMTLRALTEHYVTTGTVQFLPVDPEQSQDVEQSQTPP